MKKILFIAFFLIVNNSFGQAKQFIYEYQSIPDSTQKNVGQSEIMVLNILKDRSEYFSLEQYITDSTLLDASKKGFVLMPPNKKMISDRIIKSKNSNQIKFFTRLSSSKYYVNENINLIWKLYPEYNSVLNYKVQKATTEFGGRKWTAWFAKDIPIQDGPYKFKGLPGLIVKIEDQTKSHLFELKGIKNIASDFEYPDPFMDQKIIIESSKFVKAFKNYRKNPMAELIGKYPDQTDSVGQFKTGEEIFREEEKFIIKALKKDNNIIEIDLLKE